MENLFIQLKKKLASPAPVVEQPGQPVGQGTESVRIAAEHLQSLKNAFAENFAAAELVLPPGEAKRFECVKNLPELFEEKVREYIAMMDASGKKISDAEMISYLKSSLLMYHTPGTGIVYKTMDSVLRENENMPHEFFKSAPAALIESIAKLVIAERSA